MSLLVIGENTEKYVDALGALDSKIDIRLWPDMGAVQDIRYALAWQPQPGVLAKLPNLELIISVGAGIDHIVSDPDLPDVPLVRFVDADLTKRMCDYIVLHTLFHHRRMCELLNAQAQGKWSYLPEPDATELRVGIMGLGELGLAAAGALRLLGYQMRGWSRSHKTVEAMTTYAGDAGLAPFLAQTDILICLLPLTSATRGIINRRLLEGLARDGKLPGPVLINAGRGDLQIEADIIAALQTGGLYAATLDVFETEPLPSDNPLWSHPHVVVTPHNAAESTARATAAYTLRQITAHKLGDPLENLVDLHRGY